VNGDLGDGGIIVVSVRSGLIGRGAAIGVALLVVAGEAPCGDVMVICCCGEDAWTVSGGEGSSREAGDSCSVGTCRVSMLAESLPDALALCSVLTAADTSCSPLESFRSARACRRECGVMMPLLFVAALAAASPDSLLSGRVSAVDAPELGPDWLVSSDEAKDRCELTLPPELRFESSLAGCLGLLVEAAGEPKERLEEALLPTCAPLSGLFA
jgi:hypothetical protein